MNAERQEISWKECKAKVCQEMRLMTLNKTAKLGIILRERQKQEFKKRTTISPSNPDDNPKMSSFKTKVCFQGPKLGTTSRFYINLIKTLAESRT